MNINRKEFNKLPFIGKGTEGIVRKYTSDLVMKEMYEKSFTKEKQKSINIQCGIIVNSFIFPEDTLLINGKYKGYIQKYINGKTPTIEDLNNLKKDLEMIKEIEEEFYYLTFYRLLINDLWLKNCIFKDKLYIIDTSRYTLEEDSSYILIERENQRRINYFFLNCLFFNLLDNFSIYDLNKVMSKLKCAGIYNDTYIGVNCYLDKPLDFTWFLYNLCEELKCEELKDLHNKILKLK